MITASARTCANCRQPDTVAPIHARGLCGPCYLHRRHEFSRVRVVVPLSADDRAFIIASWGKLKATTIAFRLKRTPRSIYGFAVRLKLYQPAKVDRCSEVLRTRIKRLHGRGYSDHEIADRLKISRTTVSRWLRRYGLASNGREKNTDPHSPRAREMMSQNAHRRISEEGVEFVVPWQRRNVDGRIKAASMGWPQTETLLEARILDSLYQHGASTLLQIVSDIGGGNRCWVGSVLRGLRQRGLVAVLYRERKVCVWGLAFGLRKKWE